MIKKEKLDFWIKNNYNVLLEGLHGIGKTSIVQEAFARHNLRYKIYNAATLNVFMHIIGIPEVSKANDTTLSESEQASMLQKKQTAMLQLIKDLGKFFKKKESTAAN